MAIILLCGGFLLGTILGLQLQPPLPSPLVVTGVGALILLGGWCSWRSRPGRLATFAIAALFLGGIRSQTELASVTSSAVPADATGVSGVVLETPRRTGQAYRFVIALDHVSRASGWEPSDARIESSVFGTPPNEGDRVEVQGQIRTLVDLPGIPHATLMQRQRVTQEISARRVRVLDRSSNTGTGRSAQGIRTWIEQALRSYLPDGNAALLSGLLVGSRSTLSSEFRDQLSRTGTSHIVAVSGFNVIVVAGVVTAVASRFGGVRGGALAAMVGVGCYTAIVGAPASAVRAALMSGAALLAVVVHRPADGLVSLLAAGTIMALLDPVVVRDLGFQLSMLATAGLVLLLPKEASPSARIRNAMNILGPPVAAQIFTLPLIVYTFHSVSLIALLTNLLITGAIPIAMALGALLVVVSPVPLLGEIVAPFAWLSTEWILQVIERTATISWAMLPLGALPLWAMLACYCAVGLWLVLRSPEISSIGYLRRLAPATVGSVLLVIAIGLGSQWTPTGVLEAEISAIGDVLVARSPSGQTILVGADASAWVLTTMVAQRVPLWRPTVDVLVITELSAAQISAVSALLERYDIGILAVPSSTNPFADIPRADRAVVVGPGTLIELNDGVTLRTAGAPGVSSSTPPRQEVFLYHGRAGLAIQSSARLTEGDAARSWLLVNPATARRGTSTPGWNVTAFMPRGDALEPVAIPDSPGGVLTPARDGPIRVWSDGDSLRVQWGECSLSISGCEIES